MDSKRKLDAYYHALHQAGLRLTPQRQVICEHLAATNRHPSPTQLYQELALHHPELSRATVYNTLNLLQQLGAIVELSFGADHTHYDTDPEPHVNLICLRCHQIIDYAGDLPLDDLAARVLADTGFQPAAARMDLVGFCADCRAQRLAEIRAEFHRA